MSPSDSPRSDATRFGPTVWAQLSDDELLAMSDAEFDRLTADVVTVLHEGPLDIEPERPPESLWAAIEREVDRGGGGRSLDDGAGRTEPPDGHAHGDDAHGDDVLQGDRPLGVVPPLERKRGRGEGSPSAFRASSRWSGRAAALTLVAAAFLLVAVPLALSQRSDDPEVLAAADLEVLDPAVATFGHADLLVDDDAEALSIDFSATAPADEYLELWLLAVEDDQVTPLSLGRIDGDGTFVIPEGVDRNKFNIVDISIEANDGDESHSGRSILRGQLIS